MDSSPEVLDSGAETWGYFLPRDCESGSLAGAAVLAAFLFFGPMWVSSGKLLFDHNWKRKREKIPSQNAQIKIVGQVWATESSFLPRQPAWPQLTDAGAVTAAAASSRRKLRPCCNHPAWAGQAIAVQPGEQGTQRAKSLKKHRDFLSLAAWKIYFQNLTPSFSLRTPPWVNIITLQVWALHRKRSVDIGMIFSTGHSLKYHQKYLEGCWCFSFAIGAEVGTPRRVCSGCGFVICTRAFVQ